MRSLIACIALTITMSGRAQNLYFPPLSGQNWTTVTPASLGWCQARVDSLVAFLGARNTKAFIILKDGKIALEQYYGTFQRDSLWYWASAGKTLTAMLTGIAQQEGFLDIDDPAGTYLGTGWSSCTPPQEAQITVRNQLTMTTGLNDNVPDDDCTLPSCLQYLAPAGTRWAYHNAPYTILDEVIANATGTTFNSYFNTRLRNRTGMDGIWTTGGSPYNNVFFSRARSMARFGLLALNRGVWASDTVLRDPAYFTAMTTPSQGLNQSYGYLWWLNGQPSYMVPTLQGVFPGMLMPDAPPDMVCGLGKNDQLLNVVPSMNMVVVRMGNPAYTSQSVAINFNNQVWQYINQLSCPAGTVALRPRAFLEGPYNSGTQQMNTTLRSGGLVPLSEPYATSGYAHVGGGGGETTTSAVLAVTGANAVVDWVVVELRSAASPATVVATRSALLQADGDVVAANDGTSPVTLNAAAGSYHVAIRHRNHLGIMTATALPVNTAAGAVDMSNGTVALFGGASATKTIGSRNLMLCGDVDGNGTMKYTGAGNDRDPILVAIGGTQPNNSIAGYRREDINLDGLVRYTGAGNDRDPILVNVGGTTPNGTRAAQLP